MVRRSVVFIVAAVAVGVSWQMYAQSTVPVFTPAQSDAGRTAYAQNCAACHGDNLDDGQFAPPLRGNEFRRRWSDKTLDELFTYTSTKMPPDRVGSLENRTYSAMLAYLLEANGVQPGSRELSFERDQLRAFRVPKEVTSTQQRLRVSGLGVSPDASLPAWPVPPNPLDKIAPVSDAMLGNPPAGEWLTWRRTYDDMGFSPLKQITKDNVKNLRVAWTLSLPPGPNEATPLVHDGVIFVHSYNDNVQALDAVTGNELWHYSRRLPEGTRASTKRNIALYGNKVYFGTSDLHVVALDLKTGNVVWDRVVANSGERWNLTGGPLAAKGKVMQGIGGQGRGGAYITALDSETGVETWRFHTVARPDEPGGNTWNGLPLDDRSGGSVWTAGSYDPELNLAFFGPAPSYDTGPLRNRVDRPGMTNDALYTDATIAINPDTGKLVWHYQHVPNDQWDLDWAFERQIVRLPGTDGQTRKLVVTAGKPGIYDALEANTGKYVFSFDMGLQNFITSINPETGMKTVDAKLRLNDVPNSAPITYLANGRQYVAVVVGFGGVQPSTFAGLIPEISLPVARSSAIWVFELP